MNENIVEFQQYVLHEIEFFMDYFKKDGLLTEILHEWSIKYDDLREEEKKRFNKGEEALVPDLIKESELKYLASLLKMFIDNNSNWEKSKDEFKNILKELIDLVNSVDIGDEDPLKKEFKGFLNSLPVSLNKVTRWNDAKRELRKLEKELTVFIDGLIIYLEEEIKFLPVLRKCDEANNSGRFKFNFAMNGTSNSDNLKEICEEICFWLKSSQRSFKQDINQFIRLKDDNVPAGVAEDALLRLSLWSSIFANDENGHLSHLGFYSSVIAESMHHNEIGIIDALSQYLWKPKWTKNNYKKHIWRIDLLRSQILIHIVYSDFKKFIIKDRIKEEPFNRMIEEWGEHLLRIRRYEAAEILSRIDKKEESDDHLISELELKEFNAVKSRRVLSEIIRVVHDEEQRIQDILKTSGSKLKYPSEIFPFLIATLKGKYENFNVEEIRGKISSFERSIIKWIKQEKLSGDIAEFHNDLFVKVFRSTFYKSDIEIPPLIQLVDTNTSAWASDREVITMIVVNREKALNIHPKRRLEAYAAVPHEFGHDLIDSFQNDALINSFQDLIDNNYAISHKELWKSWINEIFADIVGVGLLGYSSIFGLIAALKPLEIPSDLIFPNTEGTSYDTHPTPAIRLFLLLHFVINYQDKGQLNKITKELEVNISREFPFPKANKWRDLFMGGYVGCSELKKEMEQIVDMFIIKEHLCLNSHTVVSYFEYLKKKNTHFEKLTENFGQIEELPDEIYSNIKFNVIRDLYRDVVT